MTTPSGAFPGVPVAAVASQRDHLTPSGRRVHYRLVLVVIGLVAAGITLVGSWHVSLWADESATISASRRSLGELLRMVHTIDAVHGCYYAFMHVWTSLFGFSPFAVRLPSALAVGATAVCVHVLGRWLAGTTTAISATAVFMLLPRSSWSGIEARPFAFTALLAVAATLVLIHSLGQPRARASWLAYAVLLGVGVAVNVYVALLAVCHLVSLLCDRSVLPRQRLRWLAAAAGGAVIASPVVFEARRQTGQLGGDELRWTNLFRNIAVNQWFLGDTPTTTTGRSTTQLSAGNIGSWWLPASIALAVVSWCLVLIVVSRGWLRRRRAGDPDQWVTAWTIPWLAIPTAVIGGYSILVHPMYSPRYLTFAAPAIAIAVGRGLVVLARRWSQIATAAVIVLLAVPIYVSQRQLYAKNDSDWVSVASFVAAHKAPGEAVYYTPRYPTTPPPIRQTTRGIALAYPKSFEGLTDLTLTEPPAAAGNLTGTSEPISAVSDRLARAYTVWVIRRRDYPLPNATADDRILASAGFTGSVVWRGPLDEVARFHSR